MTDFGFNYGDERYRLPNHPEVRRLVGDLCKEAFFKKEFLEMIQKPADPPKEEGS